MERKTIGLTVLYALGIFLGLVAIFMSYFGLPGEYDTEPLLAIGLLFISIAGLRSIKQ